MKPIIIIPEGTMSDADIKVLRDNELCVVSSKEPEKVKFVDSIPAAEQLGKIDRAAIKLSRVLLNRDWFRYLNRDISNPSDYAHIYCSILMQGTALDARGTIDERCQNAYENEKILEHQRLARADAKAEREAAKKAKALEVKK